MAPARRFFGIIDAVFPVFRKHSVSLCPVHFLPLPAKWRQIAGPVRAGLDIFPQIHIQQEYLILKRKFHPLLQQKLPQDPIPVHTVMIHFMTIFPPI